MPGAETIIGKGNKRVGMTHWNGNLLCAIDTETTGFDPELHEILEIAVLPTDGNFGIHGVFPPFQMMMRPDRFNPDEARPPGLSDDKIVNYKLHGLDSHRGADMFIHWFEKLNLGQGKKIMPLAHNWPFDCGMIHHWLGRKNYEYIFHGFYRDTMMMACMMNDLSEIKHYEDIAHPKLALGSLCFKYGIELVKAHTATGDALATMQLYGAMVKTLSL